MDNLGSMIAGAISMRRRDLLTWTPALGWVAMAATPGVTHAQAAGFLDGRDYLTLTPTVPVETAADRIELIEFFWYGCPHCNAFEPVLAKWVKTLPPYVAFRRVPVAFQQSFVAQQHLFYALEAMNLVEKLHANVFAAIHAQRRRLVSLDVIVEWVRTQGVDVEQFVRHFQSFNTETRVRRANQLTDAYRVQGVPALGVAGRYYTDGELTRDMGRALEVVSFLVNQVRSGR